MSDNELGVGFLLIGILALFVCSLTAPFAFAHPNDVFAQADALISGFVGVLFVLVGCVIVAIEGP